MAERLLSKRFRLSLRIGRKADRCQECTDQQHQQIDFHVRLRCTIAAQATTRMQTAFRPSNDSDVISTHLFEVAGWPKT